MDAARLVVGMSLEDQEFRQGLARSQALVAGFARGIPVVKLPKETSAQILTAISTLKALGVELKELGRDSSGSRVFSTLSRDAGTATAIFAKMGAEAKILGDDVAEVAIQLGKADAALRNRIALLSQGAQLNATQSASLKELGIVYAQLRSEIATSNPTLERRIQLEQQLATIRKQLAASTRAQGPTGFQQQFGNTDFTRLHGGIAGPGTQFKAVATALDQVQKKTEGVARSFALINRQTGEFTALGRRAANVAIGFGFSLDAIARGGDGAAAGLKTTLRSVAGFAAFFGPGGLIVSGVAAATAAIIELFTRSREEMTKTQKAFEDSITEMVRSGDIVAVMRELQQIELGVLTKDPNTGIFALKGGLFDLQKQLRDLKQEQKDFAGGPLVGLTKQNAEIVELEKQIARLEASQKSLTSIINNFPTLPRVPALPSAQRIEFKTGAAQEAFEKLQKELDATVTSANQVAAAIAAIRLPGGLTTGAEKLGQHLTTQRDLTADLIGFHDRLTKMLAAEADQGSVAAAAMRGMLADIEKVGDAQALLRARAFVFTMTGEVVLKPAEIQKKVTEVLGRERFVIPLVPTVTGLPQIIELTPLVKPGEIRKALDTFQRGERFVIPLFPSFSPDAIPQIISFVANMPKLEAPIHLLPKVQDFDLSSVQRAADQVKAAIDRLELEKFLGDPKKIRAQENVLADAERNMIRMMENLRDHLIKIGAPAAQVRKVMEELERMVSGLGKGADGADKFSESIHTITTAGRGLLTTADNMGLIGDQARQSLESVLQLADAVAAISKGGALNVLSGTLGLIGGGLGLLQGLGVIGETPAEREHNQILRQNNEELARVQLSLAGFSNSLSQQLNLTRNLQTPEMQAILARLARGPFIDPSGIAPPRPNLDFFNATVDFIAQLRAMGLTLDQIAAIAKDAGYTIRDSQGRLIPEAVTQWAKGVRDAAEAAFKFRDDLNGLRLRENLRRDVLNLPDTPQVAIGADLSFLKTLAPDVFAEFFGGVDLTDMAATEAAFQRLTLAFLKGEIDWEKILKFGSWEEFTAFLQGTADGFDALRDATDALTRSMQNVPSGLKLQKLIFDSLDFTARSVLQKTPALIPAPVLTPPPAPAPTPRPAPTPPVRVDLSGLQDDVAGIGKALADAGIRFDALGGPLDGFAAALLETTARISSAAVTVQRAETPFPAPAPGGATTPTPVTQPPPVTLVIEAGAIVIQGTADPAANARAVVGELKKVVKAQKGIGFHWSDADL